MDRRLKLKAYTIKYHKKITAEKLSDLELDKYFLSITQNM